MNFNCDYCGLCCEHVAEHPDIQHVGGVCVRPLAALPFAALGALGATTAKDRQ